MTQTAQKQTWPRYDVAKDGRGWYATRDGERCCDYKPTRAQAETAATERMIADFALEDAQSVMLKRAYVNNPTDDPELAEAQKAETWIKETIKEAQKRLKR
jgi:hypothetical protein